MIVMPGEQGTDEWFQMRLGIPTASNFDRIVTASGRRSAQFDQYLAECVAEWITGEPASEWGGNTDTERGHLFESDARATFEWETGIDVDQCAFVYSDDRKLVGCSPDGLIGTNSGVEIKCPRATIHVAYLVLDQIPAKYQPQVQGSMWVCDCDRWYFESYHQDYDPLIVKVERVISFDAAFNEFIPEFIEKMMAARENPKFSDMREQRMDAA